MSEIENKSRKRQTEKTEEPITISESPLSQTQEQALEQPLPPPIPPEIRDELTALIQDLLLKTHELSFEYSTSDCSAIQKCSLALKSKELFKTVKKLNELMKRVTPPPKTKYIS
ncbi:MAG: hypothetical protein QXY65_02930 [Candidatus Methanomethylicaceae archaeon]